MQNREILVVTPCLTNGGAERVLSQLIRLWQEKGCRVVLITLRSDVFTDSYQVYDGIEWIDLKPVSKVKVVRLAAHCIALRKILKRHRGAVAIAMDIYSMLVLGTASRLTRSGIIFSERNDPNSCPPSKWMRVLRDKLFYLADACVFQTEDAMNYFPSSIREKGIIIPNPINPELPEPWQGERRKTVVAVCRLTAQKNLPLMLDAFVQFHEEHPEYNLEIYGRGEEEDLLKEKIAAMHLEEAVFLKGFTHQVYDKMRDCAMYVSSSNYEGISNSMLEALGMGIPTVATDCPAGGARMAIQSGENGILVPIGDKEALYGAMKRIAEEPELAEKVSQNARKLREVFRVDRIADRWLDVVDRAIVDRSK